MNELKEFLNNYPTLYEVCKLVCYGLFIFCMVGGVALICVAINFIFKIAERIKEEWLDI